LILEEFGNDVDNTGTFRGNEDEMGGYVWFINVRVNSLGKEEGSAKGEVEFSVEVLFEAVGGQFG